MLGNKLLNIQFAKYHIWNNKSEGFPNMVLSTETLNQSVRTEYSEAVNARYTFQPLWVSVCTQLCTVFRRKKIIGNVTAKNYLKESLSSILRFIIQGKGSSWKRFDPEIYFVAIAYGNLTRLSFLSSRT